MNEKYAVLGDIHGCFLETKELLEKIGVHVIKTDEVIFDDPDLKIISVGDLIDRGPDTIKVLKLFMHLKEIGKAEIVLSNHESKLYRYLKGNPVRVSHGLQGTLDALALKSQKFRDRVFKFLEALPYILKVRAGDKELIVVHGAFKDIPKEKLLKELCLYGDVDRKHGYDVEGFPVRLNNWKEQYHGTSDVVHGHIVSPTPETYATPQESIIYGIDQGCVFGGHLTALSWPEGIITQVKAHQEYYKK